MVAYLRGHRRLAPALLWTVALVIFALLAGVALSGDLAHLLDAAARISCGVLWVLWLGTQLDWPSLRQLMRAGRFETAVATMDHALMHGVLANVSGTVVGTRPDSAWAVPAFRSYLGSNTR